MAVSTKPILFSGTMVRAIIDGRKTQTRRVIALSEFGKSTTPGFDWHFRDRRGRWNDVSMERLLQMCPYGAPGDRLWVRETWATTAQAGDHKSDAYAVYRATDPDWETMIGWKWRPSIYMPRWASRITLEVTTVRVERVQDISDADAVAEGIMCGSKIGKDAFGWYADSDRAVRHNAPAHALRALWDEINAKRGYGWDANPWVWAVEFKKEI